MFIHRTFAMLTLATFCLGGHGDAATIFPVCKTLLARSGAQVQTDGETSEREKLQSTLKNNSFEVERGLDSSDFLLGGDLIPLLKKLKPGHRWANIGAGAARTEIDGYLNNPEFDNKGSVVSVSISKPNDEKLILAEKQFGETQFRYVEKPVESTTLADFGGQADVVSDVLASVQYADSIFEVINKFAEITRVGGDILVHVSTRFNGKVKTGPGKMENAKYDSIKIYDSKNNELSLIDWLQTFKGLKLVNHKIWYPDDDPSKGENVFFHLKKVSSNFTVTPLVLMEPPKAALIPPSTYVPERKYMITTKKAYLKAKALLAKPRDH